MSFQDLSEIHAADRIRQDRELELGLFIAWHVEAFHRQKTLENFSKVLTRFRAQRKTGGGKPVQDWRVEREQMDAIRAKYAAESIRKGKGAPE